MNLTALSLLPRRPLTATLSALCAVAGSVGMSCLDAADVTYPAAITASDSVVIGGAVPASVWNAAQVKIGGGQVTASKVAVGGFPSQSGAQIFNRSSGGDSFEWGHSNTAAGYYGTLGSMASNGGPYLAFACRAGSTANTFRTGGVPGTILRSDNGGGLIIEQAVTATADNQVAVQRMLINANGQCVIGALPGQSTARLLSRAYGDVMEWGHINNGSGFYGTLGSYVSSGAPYLAFACRAGTTADTFRTDGIAGTIIRSNNAGALVFEQVTTATGNNLVPTQRMMLDATGNLGIGVTPSAANGRLQFPAGTTRANGIAFGSNGYIYQGTNSINLDFATAPNYGIQAYLVGSSATGLKIASGSNVENQLEFVTSNGTTTGTYSRILGSTTGFKLQTSADGTTFSTPMMVDNTGLVSIGSTTTTTGKLAVYGLITAKEIRVTTTGADYVFADDYKLAPLAKVEEFVTAKKHLPGMMTAKEMQDGGMPVSAVVTKQLEKIEELTLYAILADKKLTAADQQAATAARQIRELQAEKEAMKARQDELVRSQGDLLRRLEALEMKLTE